MTTPYTPVTTTPPAASASASAISAAANSPSNFGYCANQPTPAPNPKRTNLNGRLQQQRPTREHHTLSFNVSDYINNHAYSATCNLGPYNANSPAGITSNPQPLHQLIPCSPPSWQYQITQWDSETNFTVQVQHTIRGMYSRDGVFVKVFGNLQIGCGFQDEGCRGRNYTQAVTEVNMAPEGWTGDYLPRSC